MAWRLQLARRLCSAAAASLAPPPTQPPRGALDPLYHRLLAAKSVAAGMDTWLRKKWPTSEEQLFSIVKSFRHSHEYSRALDLVDWMKERGLPMKPRFHAIKLHIIAKLKGIHEAELYFSSLPPEKKNTKTCGVLITVYTRYKMERQSLSLFAHMLRLNFLDTPLNYNNLMLLFMKLERPHKIPKLFSQMKAQGIPPDKYTYSILANACDLMKDAELFERVVAEMRAHPNLETDWQLYSTIAGVYISFGKYEEAQSELKRLEETMDKTKRHPYSYLISFYAGVGNKQEVDRIWKALRKQFRKTTNSSYYWMVLALDKLDDINAMKACFKDWQSENESGSLGFDIKISNTVIHAYLKKDLFAEAQDLGENCLAKGHANSRTINLFLDYCLKHSKVELALNWFEKGVEFGRKNNWQPKVINEFVKYFEESKDSCDHYELFREKLKEIGCSGVEIKENEGSAISQEI